MLCVVHDLIQDGDTALHNAARWGHTEVVEYLLSSQAHVNVTNNVSQFIIGFLDEVDIYIRSYGSMLINGTYMFLFICQCTCTG